MKTRLLTFIGALLVSAVINCQAQATNQVPNLITNKPTTLDLVLHDLGGATNFAFEPYATYAPSAPTKLGGGALLIYNVNDYVGLGLGLDWLGELNLVSANVTLSLPFHPLPAYLPSVEAVPFLLGGMATAYSGAGKFNGNVSTVEDIGAYVKFGRFLGGRFNVGGCYGTWTGVGPYDVKRYHIFLGWSKNI